MLQNHNKIIYDWLSFTSKIHGVKELISILGMEECTWEILNGMYGYGERMYYEGISVHFNNRRTPGVWCEMSGQGCRAYETYGNGDFDLLFNMIKGNPGIINITRLDVAYDDFEGIINIDRLIKDTSNKNYIAKTTVNSIEISNNDGIIGQTVYHGSPKSVIRIRIYNKAVERGYTNGEHWIRLEMQLRDERALGFISLDDSLGIGERFRGVLHNYLRYVVPDKTDNNKWRWKTTNYWQKLIDGIEKMRIYEKPGVEYNLENLENYVYNQAGNAIETMIEIKGYNTFVTELDKRTTAKNPKYERLLNKYKYSDTV